MVDFGNWAQLTSLHVPAGSLTTLPLTASVFLLEAFALAVADLRAARRLVTWRHAAAVCYPCALGVTFIYMASFSIVPTKVALYLPPLLVACWSAAWTRRTATRRGGARG